MQYLKFTDREILNPQEMVFTYHLWDEFRKVKEDTIRIRIPEKVFEALKDYSIESVFFTFAKDYIIKCLQDGRETEEFINEENFNFNIPGKLEEYHENDVPVERV